MRPPLLLRPDRLRSIERERPFGWLSCRLLKGDLLRLMSTSAKALYLHLALAADRRGLSFWGDRRIQETIGLNPAELQKAREQLIALDLLAFDGHSYQILSLPESAPPRRTCTSVPSIVTEPVLQKGGAFYLVLAIIGILNSAISLYYYARILKEMYFTRSEDDDLFPVDVPILHRTTALLLVVPTIGLGLFFGPVVHYIGSAIAFLG
jgi:hypothetical protein